MLLLSFYFFDEFKAGLQLHPDLVQRSVMEKLAWKRLQVCIRAYFHNFVSFSQLSYLIELA